MDGFKLLIKTRSWGAILAADKALFAVKAALEDEGFAQASVFVYPARLELAKAENWLRRHFKEQAEAAK